MDREQLLQQLHQFPDSWLKTSDVATLLGVTAKQVSQLKTRNATGFIAEEHHTVPEPGKPMEWSLAGIIILGDLAGTDEAIATLDALQGAAITTTEDSLPHSSPALDDTRLQLEGAFKDASSQAEDAYVARIVEQLSGQTQQSYANHLLDRIEQGVLAQATAIRETPDQVAPILGELLALRFGLSPKTAQQVVGLA